MVRNGTWRKGGSDGAAGTPNDNFVGTISAAMMKHMKEVVGVLKFSEVNIVGNASDLPGAAGSTSVNLLDITTVNVAYIMDFSAANYAMSVNAKGVTDIKGTAPVTIANTSKAGYLALRNNVSRETRINNFHVARIHGTGGHNIASDTAGGGVKTNVIIYDHKYPATPAAASAKPYYKAFLDSTAGYAPKITGLTPTFNAQWASSDTTQPIMSMDEADWISAARASTMAGNPPTVSQYVNYGSLPSTSKWTDQAALDTNAVTSVFPAQTGIRLADAPVPEEENWFVYQKMGGFEFLLPERLREREYS